MRHARAAVDTPLTECPPPARHDRWCILAIMAVTTACFANSIGGEFVWDDIANVVANERIRSAANIPDILSSGLILQAGQLSNYYRPVPMLLLMAVRSIFGEHPAAFHALNISLHAAAAALVFLLARRLAPRARTVWPALAAAAVFALHPVNSEPVAWISGVVDVSMTFFSVLALYMYARASSVGGRLAATVPLFVALLSKEPALAVVPAMMALDLALRRERLRSAAAVLRAWAPLALVVMVYVALRVYALGGLAPMEMGERNMAQALPILLARYLELLVFPVNLTAAHDIPVSELGLRTVAVLAVLGVVTTVAVRRASRNAVWFALLVMPLAPVLYSQAVGRPNGLLNRFAERHLYLSTVGFALAIALVGAWAEERPRVTRRLAATCALALSAAFVAVTVTRNAVWHDNVSLWSDALEKSPTVASCHLNLGIALRANGEMERGAAELREAARIDMKVLEGPAQNGFIALQEGRFSRAVEALTTVTTAAPYRPSPHYFLGVALQRSGDIAAAVREYKAVLALDPGHAEATAALNELRELQ